MTRKNKKQNTLISCSTVVNMIFIFLVGMFVGIQVASNRKMLLQMTKEISTSSMSRHLSNNDIKQTSIHDLLRAPKPATKEYPKTNKTISACMLAMDDSIRLTEWIAYHYTVLPLGSLMIAIDPNSQSKNRVLKVLDLWKDRINIISYTNDSKWMKLKFDEGWGRKIVRLNGKLAGWLQTRSGPVYRSQSHKRRQNAFILHCMRHYKAKLPKNAPSQTDSSHFNPEWVLMTDSDEFLVYNYIHAEEENETSYELIRGATTEMVDSMRRKMIPKRLKLPTMERQVTVADWLTAENGKRRCWKIAGLPMSSYVSAQAVPDHNVPKGINASHLMTLQFHKTGLRTGNFSKTLLDVSWGTMDQYTKDEVQNIHNPQQRICGWNGFSGSNADYLASVFRINHYSSGSLESHVERANDRRNSNRNVSFTRFQVRNLDPVNEDFDIRPWIRWFVDKVGMEEAKRLLANPLSEAYKHFGKHSFVKAHRKRLVLPS
jgi:hypothetical protein